jgi:transcriptional regulator with XRE-family HTH domain
MKPTGKQLYDLRARIAKIQAEKELSQADISRISGVDASQVSRICSGNFKTFSYNVMQICTSLGIDVPCHEPDEAPDWVAAQSSLRRIWDETPEGARAIKVLLDAIAEVRAPRR